MMKLAHVIFVGTALATAPAFAAPAHNAAASKLPAETVQGQVRYVSGGIGRDEALVFRRAGRRYPLTLEFANKAKPHDEFTADVKVVIRDATGDTVLDTVSGGPLLLAKVPAGSYDIKATQDGRTLERHVTVVKGKRVHVGFLWPSK